MTPLERQAIIRDCIQGPPSAKLLAYELAARANKHEQCWPSQATLAKSCGLTSRTVRTALKHLVSINALVITRGRHRSALYTLTLLAMKDANAEMISGHRGNDFLRSSINKSATATSLDSDRRGTCSECRAFCTVILGDDGRHRCMRHHNRHLTDLRKDIG